MDVFISMLVSQFVTYYSNDFFEKINVLSKLFYIFEPLSWPNNFSRLCF